MQKLKWESAIEEIYSKTMQRIHELYKEGYWLGNLENTSFDHNYLRCKPNIDIYSDKPDSIAGQFFVYMPAHSFKVDHLISKLDKEYLLPLQTDGACLVIIDIGCGGATASTAIINHMFQKPINTNQVLFIGVEPNKYAIQLYDWMMKGYQAVPRLVDRINYHAIHKGIPDALTYISEALYLAKNTWKIPAINDLWVIQSNVIRPLHEIWDEDIKIRNELGLDPLFSLKPDNFGEREAIFYEQLLNLSGADKMLILTIATANDKYPLKKQSYQFGGYVKSIFNARGHQVNRLYDPNDAKNNPLSVNYINPPDSFWKQCKDEYNSKYYADVEYIQNKDFITDTQWQDLISLSNLKIAYAKVRAAQMREAFYDGVAHKWFEANLEQNLEAIKNQLLTYTVKINNDLAILYEAPKDAKEMRPKGIQTIYEEILAIALIQAVGPTIPELKERNYGYRLNPISNTEHLYRPWFRSYGRYRNAIRNAIKGSDENSAILWSDITQFYPNIPHQNLFKVVLDRFRVTSDSRIAWLLQKLVLNDNKKGILQGPLASGFWANLYLSELDTKLDEEIDDCYPPISFYRYVDDFAFVISSATDERKKNLRDLFEKSLGDLGEDLKISEKKTYPSDKENALNNLKKNSTLDSFEKTIRELTDGLYFLNSDYHNILKGYSNSEWWNFIRTYQKCLRQIGVSVEASRLSRKINQYVESQRISFNSRLKIPKFDDIQNHESWAQKFVLDNASWKAKYDKLKGDLATTFKLTWEKLKNLMLNNGNNENDLYEKQLRTEINFSVNRLARFGYDDIIDDIEELLCNYPYIIKTHSLVLEHLVLQGFEARIKNIWHRLDDKSPSSIYIRAIIIRISRFTSLIKECKFIESIEAISMQTLRNDSNDYIETLMATETLIFMPNYTPDTILCRDFDLRATEIKNNYPMLARNLIILSQRTQYSDEKFVLLKELTQGWYQWDDQYLEPVYESVELEPAFLRTHYHSRYPDNSEEFDGDYF